MAKFNKKLVLTIITALSIMALICLLLYQPFMNFLNDPAYLKEQLTVYGIWGKLILVLAMTLQVVFVFLPGEIIEIASGFCYGAIDGLMICLLGGAIGTVIIYTFVHKFGLKIINKFLTNQEFQEISFLKQQRHLEIILFVIFFIPGTPKDILTYLAPLTKIPLSTFLLITTLARIPSIITSTLGGNALSNQDYQATLLIFTITALVSGMGILLYKRYLKKNNL